MLIGYIVDSLPIGMIDYLYAEFGAYIEVDSLHTYMVLPVEYFLDEEVPWFPIYDGTDGLDLLLYYI